MAKKKATPKGELTESAHRVWLAGLGALAVAEEEGNKLFRTLVSRGEKYEPRVADPVRKASKKVTGTVNDARARASKTLDGIGAAFDDRVSGVLNRLGVPSRSEITELSRRVEKLTRAVEGKSAKRKTKTAKKKTVRRKTKTRRASA
jgi:poly(hydroxyalkanoate) granule-associated protein